MTSDHGAGALRRYVLGGSTEEESAAVEREYFKSADALDRVRAVEDDLIDEYVAGQLAPDEQGEFERHYLTTPAHRRRVAVARALRTAESVESNQRRPVAVRWRPAAALAAALIIVAVGVALMLRMRSVPTTVQVDSLPSATAPAPPPPRVPAPPPVRPVAIVVELSISPILVRGSDQPAGLTIAADTDVVRLYLQGQGSTRRLGQARAIVRTVTGDQVWSGPAEAADRTAPRALARVDIPADRLRPDDYIVELLGADTAGREVELYRYFLRVRAP
jgi:hypothetical protein